MSQATEQRLMEPLRAEHRLLLPQVVALAEVGDAIGLAPAAVQRARVDAAQRFLADQLIPHATAEDAVLYPEVDRLLGWKGGTRATDTMRRDHLEVVRLTERLGWLRERLQAATLEPDEEVELRRLLYGLHAVVVLHFAKEEAVYLPLLDRALTADEAEALVERLERASGGSAAAQGDDGR